VDDVEIQNLTSDVYLLSVLTPEFLEEVAARVEELIAERTQQDENRQEDTRIEQRALELD
jgi:hypothetical protein